MIAVKRKPAKIDSIGFWNVVKIALNEGLLASPLSGPPITVTPKNKIPKPSIA